MAIRASFLALLFVAGVVPAIAAATAPSSKAISDLRDAIVKGFGVQSEGVVVSGFDVRDAVVGHAVAYEFNVETGGRTVPLKLLEDVKRWSFVDHPIFYPPAEGSPGSSLAELGKVKRDYEEPSLPPFQLSGPLELWIQDGDDVRLALPHDVEAGALKKVVLSDGAVVTVKGARSVSLRQSLDLPLPLNRSTYKDHRVASGLLSMARALRGAARSDKKPLLSLRIVGPTSLTSKPSKSPSDKLKLKRLAPGSVELSSRNVPAISEEIDDAPITNLWPFMSVKGSEENLKGFEELLVSVLGKKGAEAGTFKLVKAKVSAQTYVKMHFTLEKKLLDGEVNFAGFPEWKTKPKKAKAHFEVLARVEGDEVIPERVGQVHPFDTTEAMSHSLLHGNVSMSKMDIVHPVPQYFTL